jgi:hypothetical protein
MHIFKREIYSIVYIIENTFFFIWIKINKIWNIEIDVYAIFKIKYGVNRKHLIIFLHQVKWFDDKLVDIHVWGLRIKPHK